MILMFFAYKSHLEIRCFVPRIHYVYECEAMFLVRKSRLRMQRSVQYVLYVSIISILNNQTCGQNDENDRQADNQHWIYRKILR